LRRRFAASLDVRGCPRDWLCRRARRRCAHLGQGRRPSGCRLSALQRRSATTAMPCLAIDRSLHRRDRTTAASHSRCLLGQNGGRRSWVEQSGVPKVRPQPGRDRMAQQLQIGVKFLDIARAWNNRRHHQMREGELQRRCRKRHPMGVADRPDGVDPGRSRAGRYRSSRCRGRRRCRSSSGRRPRSMCRPQGISAADPRAAPVRAGCSGRRGGTRIRRPTPWPRDPMKGPSASRPSSGSITSSLWLCRTSTIRRTCSATTRILSRRCRVSVVRWPPPRP
jgi:hypothetical protein